MLHFSPWKIVLILLVCAWGILYSAPNLLPKENGEAMYGQTVNLGLDLRGGSYLLLELDFDAYHKEQLNDIRQQIRDSFRGEKINDQRIGYTGGITIANDQVSIQLRDASIEDEVASLIRDISDDLTVNTENGKITVGYGDAALDRMRKNVIEQSIEIVRRRVDETGTREPDIQRQGDTRILLQVPGLDDPEKLKSLLGQTAKLTFHMVDTTVPYLSMEAFGAPVGSVKLPEDTNTPNPQYYTIKRQVMLSGDLLEDARASFTQGQPVVSFRFNSLGAKKFGDVTKKHVGEPFAIVLDEKVISAPVIREPILGGSGQISGSFTTEEANDLALLLRAGALPTPLTIIEERTVGPSLGADSITAGTNAVAIAFVFVMIFMVITYGMFGLVANVALILNVVLMFAALSLLQATLTLPGIAGIVLTIGMAVDSNILIFERIKEEIRAGRTAFAAVDQGFKQAFTTILDSNLTTLIAAILLYQFGSGPIKGFAVTLTLGILASMFSALLVTRLIVVTWLKAKRPTTLPL